MNHFYQTDGYARFDKLEVGTVFRSIHKLWCKMNETQALGIEAGNLGRKETVLPLMVVEKVDISRGAVPKPDRFQYVLGKSNFTDGLPPLVDICYIIGNEKIGQIAFESPDVLTLYANWTSYCMGTGIDPDRLYSISKH